MTLRNLRALVASLFAMGAAGSTALSATIATHRQALAPAFEPHRYRGVPKRLQASVRRPGKYEGPGGGGCTPAQAKRFDGKPRTRGCEARASEQ